MSDQPQEPINPPPPLSSEPAVESRPRPVGGLHYLIQMVLGLVMCIVVAAATIGVMIALNSPQGVWFIALGLVGLIALCIYAWRGLHWRGFLPGVLIGIGLLALALGLCMAIAKSL